MRRSVWLAIAGAITIIVVLFICTSIYNFFDSWASLPSEAELYHQNVTDLLQEIRGNINGTPMKFGQFTPCGNLLPSLMRRNTNQYTIDGIGVWGDGGTPIPAPTGGNDALILVKFSDETEITLQYWNRILVRCTVTF